MAFYFQVPVTFLPSNAPALLSASAQYVPRQANENSDSKACTLFSPKLLVSTNVSASYSTLALRVSFSTLTHCGLRKCKTRLLSDQAKYSQQSKPVTK